jgi:hypothetical protein
MYPRPATRGDVRIGHDVWLCDNCAIHSGVTIGTGAVIGAGAVVRRDVPPYAIVVGNPAVVVRLRFTPEQIDRLLNSAWWTLDPIVINEQLPLMMSADVDTFLCAIEKLRGSKPVAVSDAISKNTNHNHTSP